MNTIDLSQQDTRDYQGVLIGRVFAFFIDYLLVMALMIPVLVIYLMFGFLTLGLGFLIAPIPFIVVAALYFAFTIGGRRQASPGMRVMGLAISRDDGLPVDFLTALIHFVLFWAMNTFLTPLILLIGLFTNRGRLLHDIILGTAIYKVR